jgi:hypothetical protein
MWLRGLFGLGGLFVCLCFGRGGVLYFVVFFVILYARVPFRLVFLHGNYTIVLPRQKRKVFCFIG